MAYYDKEEGKSQRSSGGVRSRANANLDKAGAEFCVRCKEVDKEENYQVNQAKIAIAKGGFIGLAPATVSKGIFCRILILILFMQ